MSFIYILLTNFTNILKIKESKIKLNNITKTINETKLA